MSAPQRRLPPRFSLLTLILLGTIAAMAVTLWRNGEEIVPLRTELMDLRKQLGYFPIEHPDKITIQEADVVTTKAWRWQMYLPTGKEFLLHYRTGEWDDLDIDRKRSWLAKVSGNGNSFPLPGGRLILEISFEEYDGNWFFRHSYHNELQSSSSLKVTDNWLRDLLLHERFSEVNTAEPVVFEPGVPILLLHIRRNELSRAADGATIAEEVAGPVESVLVWITEK